MLPVLALIYLSFLYSLLETGRLIGMWWTRIRGRKAYAEYASGCSKASLKGFPIAGYFVRHPNASLNDVEIYALQRLEVVRIISRIAPMLGLIATLVPMEPALMSLAENNIYEMSELLRTAFTAVILGLAAASLTFWSASVKKRWFAEEISTVEKQLNGYEP